MSSPEHHSDQGAGAVFSSTQWSAVLLAGAANAPGSHVALEKLCRTYWPPLYAYVRRQGHAAADAQDLTQQFFARLLENRSLRLADPERGRFRTFLLSSLKNFLISEWQKTRAQKRGGLQPPVSIDGAEEEQRFLAELTDGLTPERIYQRRWALALLEKVFVRLQESVGQDARAPLFQALKPHVCGDTPPEGYAGLAAQLGMSEGAVRAAMKRLRDSYRRLLREEVARTVASASEIDTELRELVAALRD